MKLISSLVRPGKVDSIKQALGNLRVYSLNVAETHDFAPQKPDTTVWLGHECSLGFSMKMQIEVVVHDDDVDEVVSAIVKPLVRVRREMGRCLCFPSIIGSTSTMAIVTFRRG
jgi:nitrogen regulatory protein P-II 1